MNKISFYILLVLIFLGLSKSFSPSEHQTPYLSNSNVFPHYFDGAPLSVVLVDSFQTGFIIKTYFQRYKIFHGFSGVQYLTIRTSHDFWQKNIKNIGMTLFHRKEGDELGNTTPVPPGSLYIGDPSYGTWEYEQSGNRVWTFYRAYRHFPQVFKWGDFKPTNDFHTQLKIHLSNDRPFYGINNQFGQNGEVTAQFFENTLSYHDTSKIPSFSEHLSQKFKLPQWTN